MAKVADNMRFRPVEEIVRSELSKILHHDFANMDTGIDLINECIEYDNQIDINSMIGRSVKDYMDSIIILINGRNIDLDKLSKYLLPNLFNYTIENDKYNYDYASTNYTDGAYIRRISNIIYHNYSTLKLYVTCNAKLKKVSIIHESCLSNILQKDDNEFTSICEIIKDLEEIGEIKLV